MEKIIHWFGDHDPFDINDPSLRSLSIGFYAEEADEINCDEAELVGERLQKLFDNKSMHDAKLPRKEKVKTIANLKPGVQIENTIIHIDPSIMFMQLMAIMHQEGYVEDHFRHELTPEPSALFKDGLMRKPNKAALRNYILDKVKPEEGNTSWRCCVVDGGMLLHKMKWVVATTFSAVLSSFVD